MLAPLRTIAALLTASCAVASDSRPQEHTGTFAITNVRVFDGWEFLSNTTTYSVVVKDGLIASITPGSLPASSSSLSAIDSNNALLLPGFLDTHVHVDEEAATDLVNMRSQGITTAFDMACHVDIASCDARNLAKYPPTRSPTASDVSNSHFENITALSPFPELFQAYSIAVHPESSHAKMIAAEDLIRDADDARKHVAKRVAEGANHIKIISSTPGFDLDMLKVLAGEATKAGKVSICHAADVEAFVNAARAGCDQLHHVPINKVLTSEQVAEIKASGKVVSPTLIQMKGVISGLNSWLVWTVRLLSAMKDTVVGKGWKFGTLTYETPKENLRLLAEAGVPMLVGTDATGAAGGVIFSVHMANGFQKEVQLMAEAGVDTMTILRGTTGFASKMFGLKDRGEIAVGKRADLVLLKGNPQENVRDLQLVERVWIGGAEARVGRSDPVGGKDEL